jgi:hypothetical protein
MANKILDLKYLRFRSGNAAYTPPAVDDLLLRIDSATTAVADVHSPSVARIKSGMPCMFIDDIRRRSNSKGVMFNIHTYTAGAGADRIRQDFSQKRVTVEQGNLTGKDGRPREVVTTIRALALGQAVILERVRGAGSIAWIESYLTALFRKHLDPDMYSVSLEDVYSRGLREIIAAGGGVKQVTMNMVGAKSSASTTLGQTLINTKRLLKGQSKMRVSWEADGTGVIDEQDAIDAMNDGSIDKVLLVLKSGERVGSLNRYKARYEFDVAMVGGVVPVTVIETEMWRYMKDLRTPGPNNWRMLDNDGFFT